MQNNQLNIAEVIVNIAEAVESLTGEEVARIHNDICKRKIRYIEDNVWEYTGETD
jgi:hypothetical protein